MPRRGNRLREFVTESSVLDHHSTVGIVGAFQYAVMRRYTDRGVFGPGVWAVENLILLIDTSKVAERADVI